MPKHAKKQFSLIATTWILLTLFFILPLVRCKRDFVLKTNDSFIDFDNDGIADAVDQDDDNDGIADLIETMDDLDGDGIGNEHDRDSDGDGVPDLIEATGVDKDGDGILDYWDEWEDENDNGFHDEYEAEPLVELKTVGERKLWSSHHGFGGIKMDTDGDGVPNFWDSDSDNDGISDKIEVGNNVEKQQMTDTNADGFDDRLVGNIYTQGDDFEKSGHPEFAKLDIGLYVSVHADGSFGIINGLPDIDDDGDGIPNFLDNEATKD